MNAEIIQCQITMDEVLVLAEDKLRIGDLYTYTLDGTRFVISGTPFSIYIRDHFDLEKHRRPVFAYVK